ncbi:Uncharacterised protein [Vibrio cholerae]|nr:Uncharacterised protein [Vibrio cholerae]CSI11966.1 Uncharacterised protein [Vibrio cholerae]CSI86471.1 Uncharacterised protein [Vibrio cholerae]
MNYVELAVDAIFRPLNIHRTLVVLFNDQRLFSQLLDFGIGQ